jgi:hypothetical protein
MKTALDLASPQSDPTELRKAAIPLHDDKVSILQFCTLQLALIDANRAHLLKIKPIGIHIGHCQIGPLDRQCGPLGVLGDPTRDFSQLRQFDKRKLTHAATTSFSSATIPSSSWPNNAYTLPRPPRWAKGGSSRSSRRTSRSTTI